MTKIRPFPYSRVCVFGAARSGVGAMHLLRHHNIEVTLVDERPAMEFRSLIRRLRRSYVTAHFGPIKEDVLRGCQAIVLSPGIPLTHPLVQQAMDRDLPIISEVELASYFACAPIVAITGTNGKTTTTTLTGQMVTDAGINAVVSGNIGRAFSDAVLSSQDESRKTVLVTEVSSFQLESIEEFHPHVALILNITRDHMDRYSSMRDYIEAKYRVTLNQTEDDFLVLNADDPLTMKCAEESSAQILTFSMTKEVEEGAFVADGRIYLKEDGKVTPFCNVEDIPIPGAHNVQNTLASLVICRALGIQADTLRKTLLKFKGVEHRIELVEKSKTGVAYYNDSKATNVDSLEKALLSFENKPVILIAGGKDKQSAYDRLNSLVKERVKALILLGEAKPLIKKAWGNLVETKEAATMEEAVKIATGISRPGDVVLLSPACASFDMFKDYEDRGRVFKRCVRNQLGL
ncbi:MAG TPA: UDP-N-acetylmuramoyl-L-alanine--D-glutamate ligase [Candidatus Sumerlaeota bacterium]|nr:UDP-N-acetylmuramoyl-L-alanine--D-glutamate ligase [Candidatus Sumerlaeota bacterium]